MARFGSEVPHWLDELEEAVSETHELNADMPSTVEVVNSSGRTCLLIAALLLLAGGLALLLFFAGA